MKKVKAYRKNLKFVGLVLFLVGTLDLVWMVYCIIHRINYSSAFNIFAVIFGVLLAIGGLRTAIFVAWSTANLLAYYTGNFFCSRFIIPLDLTFIEWKIYPLFMLEIALKEILVIGFLFWIYKRLTRPEIAKAIKKELSKTKWKFRYIKSGFVLGMIFLIISQIFIGILFHSSIAQEAVAKADQKVGPGYKLTISNLNIISGNGITRANALVVAYNDNEVKTIPIQWEEQKSSK